MAEKKKKPAHRPRLTFGQRMADKLTTVAGSWTFIIGFLVFVFAWMFLNVYFAILYYGKVMDPYPFILLNLVLSCLAAIQAPVILMSQNRAVQRDRARAEKDYYVDRKAEKEIKVLQRDLLELKSLVSNRSMEKEIVKIEAEIKHIQEELEHLSKGLHIE